MICSIWLLLDVLESQVNYAQSPKIVWPYHIGVKSYEFEKKSNFESPHDLFLQAESHITWHDHTSNVLQRVLSWRVRYLYRLNPIPDYFLGRLYCVFALLIMDYCDVVWMPSSAMHFKQLEKMHSKFSDLRSTACSSMTITLTEWWCYHTAIQVYRSLNKFTPSYLHDTFNHAVDITGRVACNAHCLFLPRVRTALVKNSCYF